MRAAVALEPALVEAHTSLGFVLTAQGRLDEAITACRTAVGLDPLSAEAHWNLATALLLAGDYQRGFSEYEWHRKHPLFRTYWRELPGRAWNGESLEGTNLAGPCRARHGRYDPACAVCAGTAGAGRARGAGVQPGAVAAAAGAGRNCERWCRGMAPCPTMICGSTR